MLKKSLEASVVLNSFYYILQARVPEEYGDLHEFILGMSYSPAESYFTYGLLAVGVGGKKIRRQLRQRLVAFGLYHDHGPPASQINPVVDGVHAPNKATTMSFASCTVSYNAPIPSSQRHRPPLCLPSEQQILRIEIDSPLGRGPIFSSFPLLSLSSDPVRARALGVC